MKYEVAPRGVCARKIVFDIEDGVVRNVEFFGGCNGNLKAISKLVEGKNAEEISDILAGNTCGMKNTSCADQFSKALKAALAEENNG
jgi:uncharacterized protein (TIGR03905 family)